jgi:hypothetical protein
MAVKQQETHAAADEIWRLVTKIAWCNFGGA